jgi:hypothetical protein
VTYEDYLAHLAALDSLRDRAAKITMRLAPFGWQSIHVENFGPKVVEMVCYWPNYETEDYNFPAEWLFRDDWEQLVDQRLAEQEASRKAEEEDQAAKVRQRELQELLRLEQKYR